MPQHFTFEAPTPPEHQAFPLPLSESEKLSRKARNALRKWGIFARHKSQNATYKWLDRAFPGTTKVIIVKKLVLDQFVLTPYLLTVFYAGMSIMEGSEDVFLELREKFVPTFMRSCIFWLPAQALNFSLVAPRFRVIYMGICGLIWVNILCWTKRQSLPVATKEIATDASKSAAAIRNSET
ncbi:mpv17-like protein isoform X2 [Drosophila teissieri]|uniref:mpv17-like protein isoform X2 n=1 Tax=Drosophila teissieri TaxID=7243 RepID=UPI001CB9F779|nr:mpv17-like protein isoform X2 [Drosophila teissieri]